MKVFELECANENLWRVPKELFCLGNGSQEITHIGVMLLAKKFAQIAGKPIQVEYVYTDGFVGKRTYLNQ